MTAGSYSSMHNADLPQRLWAALLAANLIWRARGQIPMSDWRTGIATNYGGAQDWRVGRPSCQIINVNLNRKQSPDAPHHTAWQIVHPMKQA